MGAKKGQAGRPPVQQAPARSRQGRRGPADEGRKLARVLMCLIPTLRVFLPLDGKRVPISSGDRWSALVLARFYHMVLGVRLSSKSLADPPAIGWVPGDAEYPPTPAFRDWAEDACALINWILQKIGSRVTLTPEDVEQMFGHGTGARLPPNTLLANEGLCVTELHFPLRGSSLQSDRQASGSMSPQDIRKRQEVAEHRRTHRLPVPPVAEDGARAALAPAPPAAADARTAAEADVVAAEARAVGGAAGAAAAPAAASAAGLAEAEEVPEGMREEEQEEEEEEMSEEHQEEDHITPAPRQRRTHEADQAASQPAPAPKRPRVLAPAASGPYAAPAALPPPTPAAPWPHTASHFTASWQPEPGGGAQADESGSMSTLEEPRPRQVEQPWAQHQSVEQLLQGTIALQRECLAGYEALQQQQQQQPAGERLECMLHLVGRQQQALQQLRDSCLRLSVGLQARQQQQQQQHVTPAALPAVSTAPSTPDDDFFDVGALLSDSLDAGLDLDLLMASPLLGA